MTLTSPTAPQNLVKVSSVRLSAEGMLIWKLLVEPLHTLMEASVDKQPGYFTSTVVFCSVQLSPADRLWNVGLWDIGMEFGAGVFAAGETVVAGSEEGEGGGGGMEVGGVTGLYTRSGESTVGTWTIC